MEEHTTEYETQGTGIRGKCSCGWVGITWRKKVDALVDVDLHHTSVDGRVARAKRLATLRAPAPEAPNEGNDL